MNRAFKTATPRRRRPRISQRAALLWISASWACFLGNRVANAWSSSGAAHVTRFPTVTQGLCADAKHCSALIILHAAVAAASNDDDNNSSSDLPDITNKRIFQRVFYRLTPGSDVEQPDAVVVEERVQFVPDPKKGAGYLQPVGKRELILRDGRGVEEGTIGDVVFRLQVYDSTPTHQGAGGNVALEASVAAALYLSANPALCRGAMLEVSCDLGLSSLLGCIGARHALMQNSGAAVTKHGDTADDVLTIPKNQDALLPPDLERLTLLESRTDRAQLAYQNVHHAQVSPSKVQVDELDWTLPRPPAVKDKLPHEYQTIVAADVAFTYPEAKVLAKFIAHRLLPSKFAQIGALPRFVHVCPDARQDAVYLRQLLEKGYLMTVHNQYLKLETIVFAYQMIDQAVTDHDAALDELELDVQDIRTSVYEGLVAAHHAEYAGQGTGEYFFPMETGEYDAASASASGNNYLERERNRKTPW